MDVEGVGRIALPLCPDQAASLLAASEVAPFGKGSATVIDPAVRRTQQIDGALISFAGSAWRSLVASLAERACKALGLDAKAPARAQSLPTLQPMRQTGMPGTERGGISR